MLLKQREGIPITKPYTLHQLQALCNLARVAITLAIADNSLEKDLI